MIVRCSPCIFFQNQKLPVGEDKMMVKRDNPEIKVGQNGIKKDPSFIKRQASKIFDLNQALLWYTSDFIKNSSSSLYIGGMSMSLWCILRLLDASKYLEHITGADFVRYEKNAKSKTYKIDSNTIKVYGENVPIKEGKVKEIRDSIESKKHSDNNNFENVEIKTTKVTTTSRTIEYEGTKELQEIVNSLREILERKAPIADDELNEVIARLNGKEKLSTTK